MASPISNFVVLSPGVQKKLRFKDHQILKRVITDPIRKIPVERDSLMMYVSQEDGSPADKVYSIISQKHAAEFAGYLPAKNYTRYEFTVVKDAPGTVPPRIVSVVPV